MVTSIQHRHTGSRQQKRTMKKGSRLFGNLMKHNKNKAVFVFHVEITHRFTNIESINISFCFCNIFVSFKSSGSYNVFFPDFHSRSVQVLLTTVQVHESGTQKTYTISVSIITNTRKRPIRYFKSLDSLFASRLTAYINKVQLKNVSLKAKTSIWSWNWIIG